MRLPGEISGGCMRAVFFDNLVRVGVRTVFYGGENAGDFCGEFCYNECKQ